MKLFGIFSKPKPVTQSETKAKSPHGEDEEFVVHSFVPKKIPMTKEVLRRQREQEMRDKYCSAKIKTGVMM